ncbi:MAG: KUP/HAK/KT family potassium transporter [Spirochaetia bacterium]|nr:KUP/HAK/KT family potassium transporter [Spirochaetia bacterium]
MNSDSQKNESSHEKTSLLQDLRLVFATILTDPGSSLAYGADALVAVTAVLIYSDYSLGVKATVAAAAVVMTVYLFAILVYNKMTRVHTHKILGGGAFVSSHITSSKIKKHPRLKKIVGLLGKTGTASLLADFPATQAISIIAGVEALYFIPIEERLQYALLFIIFLSFVQRYGLANLAKYMIWPVLLFYTMNILINGYGISMIMLNGWERPVLPDSLDSVEAAHALPFIFGAIANGATLITGVEVGYSSVNIPHFKGKTIRISMWILYAIVLVTYSMQIINFLGLGVTYNTHIPLPLQIANHLGGDHLAVPFGIVTAIMLLLAAQTAQTDFPLEVLRASRMNFFPRGIGDMSWKKTKSFAGIGGHGGVYNPRTTLILGILSITILYFFPSSHKIESMYGLAVLTAMNIDVLSFMIRQIRVKKISFLTVVSLIFIMMMLLNIIYNKFFEGAWFIVFLMVLYLAVFLISEAIYSIWKEKLDLVPLEFGLWYPAFQNLPIDEKNIVLVSKFHPGVVLFLKNYIKRGSMPLVIHFLTDKVDHDIPRERPDWFRVIHLPPNVDTISVISNYIKKANPDRVHLIPLLVKGYDSLMRLYFGNSIERLKEAISQHASLQVEYNKERIVISFYEIIRRIFPLIKKFR